MAITTEPGKGCAPASFGLCHYPRGYYPGGRTGKRSLPTYLTAWLWRSGSKTQLASGASCGGISNFLHCHLRIIGLLDFLRDTGLVEVQVSDDGGFWTNRDVDKLAQAVFEWNQTLYGSTAINLAETESAIRAAINSLLHFEDVKQKGHQRLRLLRDKESRNEA